MAVITNAVAVISAPRLAGATVTVNVTVQTDTGKTFSTDVSLRSRRPRRRCSLPHDQRCRRQPWRREIPLRLA